MKETTEKGRLLFRTCRLHSTRADQFMDQIGLFRGQAMLLKFISKHDGLTHSEVASKLEISPAAVTKVIKRLEELNYLKRQSDPNDDRVSRIFIQPEGRKKIEEIHTVFDRLDELIFRGFAPEELAIFQGFMKRIQENLQDNDSKCLNQIN